MAREAMQRHLHSRKMLTEILTYEHELQSQVTLSNLYEGADPEEAYQMFATLKKGD